MHDENSGVYIIYNTVNGKMYVGISTNIRKRYGHHRWASRRKVEFPIHKAIRKYGIDRFVFKTVEFCDDREALKQKEILWISTLKALGYILYNISPGGDMSTRRPEHCLAQSIKMSGVNNFFYGKKLSGSLNGHYGKKMLPHVKDILLRCNSKFEKSDVINIRKLHLEGVSQTKISQMYKCHLVTIHNIVNNQKWKDPSLPTRKTKPRLKPEQVIQIRDFYSSGKFTYEQLAQKFNVSIAQICRIVTRQKWKNI